MYVKAGSIGRNTIGQKNCSKLLWKLKEIILRFAVVKKNFCDGEARG